MNVNKHRSKSKSRLRRATDYSLGEKQSYRILPPAEASKAYMRMMQHDLSECPTLWTPEYVGLRLIEAYETLSRTPRVRGPAPLRALGSPRDYTYTREELDEHEQSAPSQVAQPTKDQIDRMEQAFDWLSSYLGHLQNRKALQTWAHSCSKGQTKPHSHEVYDAMVVIATCLQVDRIRVS